MTDAVVQLSYLQKASWDAWTNDNDNNQLEPVTGEANYTFRVEYWPTQAQHDAGNLPMKLMKGRRDDTFTVSVDIGEDPIAEVEQYIESNILPNLSL
ncbi:hypothetical protein [Paraferrimonas haliotis]|uniref:hypothetical protein n=1 Tax=Paraferrimonas haliotis TaxID=2013866 RepID=UPI000F795239|nr:hypothetical protein [Paraferrimonas haliotis]